MEQNYAILGFYEKNEGDRPGDGQDHPQGV